jgi:hypothetical protein
MSGDNVAQPSFLHFLSAIIVGVTKTLGFDFIAYFVKQVFLFVGGSHLSQRPKRLKTRGCAFDAVA